MNYDFSLRERFAADRSVHPEDVLALKNFLVRIGLYSVPDWGVTPYPDQAMVDAIKAFQKSNGLTVDGRLGPGGETETAIKERARHLQNLGRNGDTLLAHITPQEAALLKEHGGAGTVNPRTGLLEFYDTGEKKGQYVWRTRGDGNVRSTHAEREGKVFSWNDPPEGGHPGEAPNCRCRAEEIDCMKQWVDLREIIKELMPLEAELSRINMRIHNLKLDIAQNEADIDHLEYASTALSFGGGLTTAPHFVAKFFGYASEITAVMVARKIDEINLDLHKNKADLDALEKDRAALEDRVKPLTHKEGLAREAYAQCTGKRND